MAVHCYVVLPRHLLVAYRESRAVLQDWRHTLKGEHITPALVQLYWLPVRYRSWYMILLHMFKIMMWAGSIVPPPMISYKSTGQYEFSYNTASYTVTNGRTSFTFLHTHPRASEDAYCVIHITIYYYYYYYYYHHHHHNIAIWTSPTHFLLLSLHALNQDNPCHKFAPQTFLKATYEINSPRYKWSIYNIQFKYSYSHNGFRSFITGYFRDVWEILALNASSGMRYCTGFLTHTLQVCTVSVENQFRDPY